MTFARETKDVTQLYGADLAGGAVDCMAVVPLLNALGGSNVVICAALAMIVAAGIWRRRQASAKVRCGHHYCSWRSAQQSAQPKEHSHGMDFHTDSNVFFFRQWAKRVTETDSQAHFHTEPFSWLDIHWPGYCGGVGRESGLNETHTPT